MGVGRYATGLGRYELDDRRSGEGCLTTGGGGGAGAGNFGSGWRVETEAGAGAGGRGGSLRAGAVVPFGSTVPRLPAATGGCACGCSEWIFLGAIVSSRLLLPPLISSGLASSCLLLYLSLGGSWGPSLRGATILATSRVAQN